MNALVQSGKSLLKGLGQREKLGIGVVGGLLFVTNFWYKDGSSTDVNNPFIPDMIEGYVDNTTDEIVEGYKEFKTEISSEVADVVGGAYDILIEEKFSIGALSFKQKAILGITSSAAIIAIALYFGNDKFGLLKKIPRSKKKSLKKK